MADTNARQSGDRWAIYYPILDLWWQGPGFHQQLSNALLYTTYEGAVRAARAMAKYEGLVIALVECRVQVDAVKAMQSARRLAMAPPARGLFG